MLNVIENAKHKSETTANFAELLIYQENPPSKLKFCQLPRYCREHKFLYLDKVILVVFTFDLRKQPFWKKLLEKQQVRH